MEAIILAGGKAERLGDAARRAAEAARPRRAAGRSPRTRSPGSCGAGVDARDRRLRAPGRSELFDEALAGLGAEIVAVGEPEPLGRGGGLRFAAAQRARGAGRRLRAERRRAARRRPRARSSTRHRATRRGGDDRRRAVRRRRSASSSSPTTTSSPASSEAPRAPALGQLRASTCSATEALARLPERGDHETSDVPGARRRGQARARSGTRASG